MLPTDTEREFAVAVTGRGVPGPRGAVGVLEGRVCQA